MSLRVGGKKRLEVNPARWLKALVAGNVPWRGVAGLHMGAHDPIQRFFGPCFVVPIWAQGVR